MAACSGLGNETVENESRGTGKSSIEAYAGFQLLAQFAIKRPPGAMYRNIGFVLKIHDVSPVD